MADKKPPDTVTLEQAWHFLMTQFAYRNPAKVTQAQLARRTLHSIMRQRRGVL